MVYGIVRDDLHKASWWIGQNILELHPVPASASLEPPSPEPQELPISMVQETEVVYIMYILLSFLADHIVDFFSLLFVICLWSLLPLWVIYSFSWVVQGFSTMPPDTNSCSWLSLWFIGWLVMWGFALRSRMYWILFLLLGGPYYHFFIVI